MSKKYPVNALCPCGAGKKYKKCHGNPATDGENSAAYIPELAKLDDIELVAYTDW